MTEPGVGAAVSRAARMGMILIAAAARLLGGLLWDIARHRPARLTALAVAARTLERLGPAYIKIGQLLSTRVDVLPPTVCRELSRLYDQVAPMPAGVAADVVPADLLELAGSLRLVGAGGIACVYHARLPDGQELAVKVRRPGIERAMRSDLALVRAAAALAQRLPGLRGTPVSAIAGELCESILLQLDFIREADSLRRLRENLAEESGVLVPAVVDKYSGPDVLVMDYVDGLRRRESGAADQATATRALHAAYHMLFLDGFVHCDLHPGNLHLMPDGAVVIVDAGFSWRLTDSARRAFALFFYYMSRGDGAACADVVLSTALRSGDDGDEAAFRDGLTRLVHDNSRIPIGEFDLVSFAVRLFALQRKHGYYADPEFVFPILSLIVLDGALRAACPEVDFQTEAIPYLLRGMMKPPDGTAATR